MRRRDYRLIKRKERKLIGDKRKQFEKKLLENYKLNIHFAGYGSWYDSLVKDLDENISVGGYDNLPKNLDMLVVECKERSDELNNFLDKINGHQPNVYLVYPDHSDISYLARYDYNKIPSSTADGIKFDLRKIRMEKSGLINNQ